MFDSVFDDFMTALETAGAVRLNSTQIVALTEQALRRDKNGYVFGKIEYIGRNASVLANACGMNVSDDIRLLFGEVPADHPFVIAEQMMPFMPVVRVKSLNDGIEKSLKAEHRFGHTAMIHSNNLDNITAFTRALDTDIVVVNGPCVAGNGPGAGEGYFSHTIASPTGTN